MDRVTSLAAAVEHAATASTRHNQIPTRHSAANVVPSLPSHGLPRRLARSIVVENALDVGVVICVFADARVTTREALAARLAVAHRIPPHSQGTVPLDAGTEGLRQTFVVVREPSESPSAAAALDPLELVDSPDAWVETRVPPFHTSPAMSAALPALGVGGDGTARDAVAPAPKSWMIRFADESTLRIERDAGAATSSAATFAMWACMAALAAAVLGLTLFRVLRGTPGPSLPSHRTGTSHEGAGARVVRGTRAGAR